MVHLLALLATNGGASDLSIPRFVSLEEAPRSIYVPVTTNLHLNFDTERLRTHLIWSGAGLQLNGTPHTGSKTPFLSRPLGQVLAGEELFTRAYAALSDLRYDEATRRFLEVLRLVPRHYPSWGNLGAAYLALDRTDEAVHCLNRALELNPNSIIDREKLGIVRQRLLDSAEADQLSRAKSRPGRQRSICARRSGRQ